MCVYIELMKISVSLVDVTMMGLLKYKKITMSSKLFWGRLQPQYSILKMQTADLSKRLANFYWLCKTS
jgi:hypothetical protein